MKTPLLNVENLTVSFKTDEGKSFKAVDDISFHVDKGEIVGLVGESGCGKSVTALSLLRLIPSPAGRIDSGRILLNEKDILKMSPAQIRQTRGNAISMIFQEPTAALSPLHRVGEQLVETLRLHRDISKSEARKTAETWLKKVGIPGASERMDAYPFQLSGGMQQRIVIAMALILEPDLIIADEPTTALDVTIQAQIFELIRQMKQKDVSILLITHDMGVVWEMCDRVYVMYASRIVEESPLEALFDNPAHPYTIGLLRSIPKLTGSKRKLEAISGQVPSPLNYPKGCHFQDRCPHVFDRCRIASPDLFEIGNQRRAACFIAEKMMTSSRTII